MIQKKTIPYKQPVILTWKNTHEIDLKFDSRWMGLSVAKYAYLITEALLLMTEMAMLSLTLYLEFNQAAERAYLAKSYGTFTNHLPSLGDALMVAYVCRAKNIIELSDFKGEDWVGRKPMSYHIIKNNNLITAILGATGVLFWELIQWDVISQRKNGFDFGDLAYGVMGATFYFLYHEVRKNNLEEGIRPKINIRKYFNQ